ncbi:TonB-dependent receptor [Derxia gummosa]|uniref:TonB-dependent receptor n=1 Tax=Derxia gummosa DSM 723 TaxID=1121388 RepID=A0A8B6XAD7_9BURK|nr:TonB-dependent receptor [Derxia gummosa]
MTTTHNKLAFPFAPRRLAGRVAAIGLGAIAFAAGAQTVGLPPVVVEGGARPLQSAEADSAGTVYVVTPAAVDAFGPPGGANPYRMVSTLPSVLAGEIDPWGAANITGGNKGLRVRGLNASHGGNGSVDGLVISAINPGPGYLWLFDAENLAGVSLAQGPVAPDRGAIFTTTGALDSQLLWPTADAGLRASVAAGSHEFRRVAARLDSGELSTGTRLFASGSNVTADKWRGEGGAPGDRTNLQFALGQRLGPVDLRFTVLAGSLSQNQYRALSWAQTQNLSASRGFDFDALPGAARQYWYGFNRQNYDSSLFIAEADWKLGADSLLSARAYGFHEKGSSFDGQANGMVREWLMDHRSAGGALDYTTRLAGTTLKAGAWLASLEPPGPPTAWKMYRPNADGSLSFASWSLLNKPTANHRFDAVYAMAERRFGPADLTLGLRQWRERLPGMDAYATTGLGDGDTASAIAAAGSPVAARSVRGRSHSQSLPFVALALDLDRATQLRASAGKLVGAPSFDAWQVYQNNAAAFAAAGVSAQSLWDASRPETANAFDLGLRWQAGAWSVEPTVYRTNFSHKAVAFRDPRVNLAYSQNVGEGHADGVQLAAAWALAGGEFSGFASASFNRAVFDQDLTTATGGVLPVKGRQFPDTPRWLASLGGRWAREGWSVAPLVQAAGMRYGDSTHAEPVGGYWTADLQLAKAWRVDGRRLTASVTVGNLFDRRYVGLITSGDQNGSGGLNYYPAPSRSAVAKLAVEL